MHRAGRVFAVLTLAVLAGVWPERPAAAEACLVPVGPPDGVGEMLPLADGTVLVSMGGGALYRIGPDGSAIAAIDHGGLTTGSINDLVALPDGRVLVGAHLGLFVLAASASVLEPYAGDDGAPLIHGRGADVFVYGPLPDGRVLLRGAWNFLFLDPATNAVTQVDPDDRAGRVLAFYALSETAWLLDASNGPFRLDADAAGLVQVGGDHLPRIEQIWPADPDGWYLGTESALHLLRGRRLTEVFGRERDQVLAELGRIYAMHPVSDGDWLVGADYGLVRFDADSRSLHRVALNDVNTVIRILGGSDGPVLAVAINGLRRVDPGADAGTALGSVRPGTSPSVAARPGGGWLIGTEDGLVAVDAALTDAAPVPGLEQGFIEQVVPLEGAALAVAGHALYRVDPGAPAATLIPGPSTEEILHMATLADGRLLLGTARGLFLTVETFAQLAVSLENAAALNGRAPDESEVRTEWMLQDGCAPAAAELGLLVVADNAADGLEPGRYTPLQVSVDGAGARVIATVAFPTAGRWTLQLVSTATGVDRPLGAPVTVAVDASIWDSLQRSWEWIAGAAGAAYVGIFALLFLLAHRKAWAFRILSDPVWSRVGIWPFFLIRHWRPAQRWVLEPWFQALRRKPWPDTPFYDVPVTGPDGTTIEATALLDRLSSEPRLWLMGHAGMGKSTVFEQWERAYYDSDPATLPAAVRRFGFVLVTLPVRHVARLPADPNHPEMWVVDAVQRRLQRFGMPIDDLDLVKAMLRAGGLALVLDGMNEADRDPALAAFANAFPMVPLLATSQNDGPGGFAVWRLPPDITGFMDRLLELWLGPDGGRALAGRIRRDEIGTILRSGYDLRLVVDLAGDNPEDAALPTTRAGLYRAALARVEHGDLAPVKKLAWAMVIDSRREIRRDDLAEAVGEQLPDALEAAHVLRPVAEAYEFRHDQMRAFLAALWLVEETPGTAAIAKRLADPRNDGRVWRCSRRDQEELWRFVADLLATPEDRALLWAFALEDPERGFLQFALKARADAEGQVLTTGPAEPVA